MRLCVRLAAFCAFIALLQSQALWFDDNRLILPVPVLDIFGGAMPVLIARFFYYSVLGATAVLFVRPDLRYLCFYPPAVFLFWVLRDALRLQPQLYMFMFTLLAAGAMPAKIDNRALDPLRLMAIGSYFWAGFYKINIHFVQDIFPWFVGDVAAKSRGAAGAGDRGAAVRNRHRAVPRFSAHAAYRRPYGDGDAHRRAGGHRPLGPQLEQQCLAVEYFPGGDGGRAVLARP